MRKDGDWLTCDEMMLLVWTAILYSDDPTVLVLTEAAFLLVTATIKLEASFSMS